MIDIIILIIVLFIIFYFFIKKKYPQSKIIKTTQKILSSFNKIFIILTGLGLIFLPDVGPIGVPWSFALAFGFFIYIAYIYYFIRDIRKKNKFGIIWCLFVLIFYPISLKLNGLLWNKGINDMKIYSIKLQNECNQNKKCQNLKAPWTKDYKNTEIKNDSFEISIVHMETYYTFTGGINKSLLLEVHNIDTDFSGKNKKYFKYQDNNWIKTK